VKLLAGIARHRTQAPDPLGFDALRLQAITAAQQASGELWTDFNLHDPGVSLLEALCFALTEDLFAARQPVPQLLGLDAQSGAADWARFGLHTPQALLPCHPCTDRDWQLWLLQQLPHARQLHMQALRDGRGRASGLWHMALQCHTDAPEDKQALRSSALKAYWPQRNLGEDLDGPPQALRSRWVELEVSLQLEGQRDVCELLAELLQRCDDCISARLPEGLPPSSSTSPELEGPLGRAITPVEALWLEQDPDILFVSDLARYLQGMEGLAAIDTLLLHLAPDEPKDPLDDVPAPPGSVRRRGRDWALRLRWPDHADQLSRWQLTREGGLVQVPMQSLLQMLSDRRRLPLRLAPSSATTLPAVLPPADLLPALPTLNRDHYAASAALPPVYRQAMLDNARHQPGLRAQWHGYLGLLEQGLNQVQVQREQLPHLYALDEDDTRSCWTSLPGDDQLAGIEALYRQPREQLETAPWVDEDKISRRHRALNYQLALHGESLDHASLQALPCYFTPQAWPAHLLRLKRQFGRRLLRLGRQRGVGADLSQPLIGKLENTPPLQERVSLMLGFAKAYSRWLSGSWQGQGLPAPEEWPEPQADGTQNERYVMRAPEAALSLLNPAARRRSSNWPALRNAMPVLRDALPAPLLRAAVRPDLYLWTPDAGGQLWLGPDDQKRYWLLRDSDYSGAQDHARALHEAACQLQAAGEGLHLVEHLLLRPLTSAEAGVATADATGAQISLVFSGWTARGADPRFRRLTQQIVAREAPAHLRCRLLWLDAGRMQAFEAAWHAWLTARAAHCAALLETPDPQDDDAALKQLDERSARLRALLQEVAT
jgi:hypothetical protein